MRSAPNHVARFLPCLAAWTVIATGLSEPASADVPATDWTTAVSPDEIVRMLAGPSTEEPLSLERALKDALERNPGLVYARIDVRRSEETLAGEKGSLYLPSLSGSAGRSVSNSLTSDLLAVDVPPASGLVELKTGSAYASLGVSEPLPTGGSIWVGVSDTISTTSHATRIPTSFSSSLRVIVSQPLLRSCCWGPPMGGVRRAKADLESARARLQRELNDLAADVMNAYWDLVFARTDLELKRAAIENLDRRLAWTEKTIAEGRVARTDIIQVRASRAAALDTFISTLNTVLDAEETLKTLVGVPAAPKGARVRPRPIDAVPIGFPESPSLDVAFARAMAISPDIAIRNATIRRAALDRKLAADALWPRLDFTASFAARGSGDTRAEEVADLGDFATSEWSVGITFSYPLFYNTDKAAARKARLTLDERELELEEAKRELHEELDNVLREVAAARLTARLATLKRELSASTLAAEEEKFADGRTTLKDLLDFQEALEQARVTEARERVDLVKAIVKLGEAQGTLIEVMAAH